MSTRGAGSADRHFTAPHRGDLRVPRRRPVAALERGVPVRSDGIEVSVGVADVDGPVHDHRGGRDRSACIEALSLLPIVAGDTSSPFAQVTKMAFNTVAIPMIGDP